MCDFVNNVWTPCADPDCPSKRPQAIDLLRDAMKPKADSTSVSKQELSPKVRRQLELLDELQSIVREKFGGGSKEKR